MFNLHGAFFCVMQFGSLQWDRDEKKGGGGGGGDGEERILVAIGVQLILNTICPKSCFLSFYVIQSWVQHCWRPPSRFLV